MNASRVQNNMWPEHNNVTFDREVDILIFFL